MLVEVLVGFDDAVDEYSFDANIVDSGNGSIELGADCDDATDNDEDALVNLDVMSSSAVVVTDVELFTRTNSPGLKPEDGVDESSFCRGIFCRNLCFSSNKRVCAVQALIK